MAKIEISLNELVNIYNHRFEDTLPIKNLEVVSERAVRGVLHLPDKSPIKTVPLELSFIAYQKPLIKMEVTIKSKFIDLIVNLFGKHFIPQYDDAIDIEYPHVFINVKEVLKDVTPMAELVDISVKREHLEVELSIK